MKGTKLWQAPGSPIIQGRSRTERPFFERWVGGFVGAEVCVLAAGMYSVMGQPDVETLDAVQMVATTYFLPGLPGALVGSALGTWLARGMGWRRHWVAGTITGAALAGMAILLF